MEPIHVAVIDEQAVFRRGVVACLDEQPDLSVVVDAPRGPLPTEVDVAVVSLTRAADERFPCPLLVCVTSRGASEVALGRNRVLGELPIAGLTPALLVSATRAAATGLAISVAYDEGAGLDARSLLVLQLLAEGADTRVVARRLGCSPRTVKTVVRTLKATLEARTRAQAVARAIREGLI